MQADPDESCADEYWSSIWEHVEELRKTLLRLIFIIGSGFLILFIFYQPILTFLTAHYQETTHLSKQPSLLILGPTEGFVLVCKMCFWLSATLTAPFWGWVLLQFILPGLHGKERSLLLPFLLLSFIALWLGILLAWYVTLPITNDYLLAFNSSIGQNAWTLSHYIHYVLVFCLGHAIAAECVILLLTLVHFQFLRHKWLIEKRRHMIVFAFIMGAVLTPPDIFSQILLAIPLIFFYELAILYAKWCNQTDYFT